MYEVILKNGDRAEAEDLSAVPTTARTLRDDAVEHGASPRIGRETYVTRDGRYDAAATAIARGG